MNHIKCIKCKELKPENLFSVRKESGKFRRSCKECEKKRQKIYRQENSKEISLRYKKWYDENQQYIKEYRKEYLSTNKGIWVAFKSKKKKDRIKIDENEFINWYEKEEKKCFYCGLDKDESNKLIKIFYQTEKEFNLQIDRKDSSLDYEIKNIVLACKICNDHKKDFFSATQFSKIAKKYLGKNLLKENN